MYNVYQKGLYNSVQKNRSKTQVFKISDKQIRLRFGMANFINTLLKQLSSMHTTQQFLMLKKSQFKQNLTMKFENI